MEGTSRLRLVGQQAGPLEAEGEVRALAVPHRVVAHRVVHLALRRRRRRRRCRLVGVPDGHPAAGDVAHREVKVLAGPVEQEGPLRAGQPEAEASLVLDRPLEGAGGLVEEVDSDLVVVHLALKWCAERGHLLGRVVKGWGWVEQNSK